MPKYYFTPAGNRRIALALSNLNNDDFKFQHDHKSEIPDDIIFIPYFPKDTDTPVSVYGKSKFLAMLIGGSFNISLHDEGNAAEVTLDWLIDWESEQRVQIANPKEILPENPFVPLTEAFDMDKAKELRAHNFISYAIYLSKHDRFVNSLLLLASQQHSFVSLYAMLDTIETKAKFPKIDDKKSAKQRTEQRLDYLYQQAAITEQEIKAFTGTANNYGLLGLQSRHGDMDWGVPSNTMDLKTATKLILRLAYFTIYHHINI